MMTMTMTNHAAIDRLDRLATCVEKLGMSKFILEAKNPNHPGTVNCLTSTGIIIVQNATTGVVITGFMATTQKVAAMYHSAGYDRVPPKIFARVQKNCSRYSYLLAMQKKGVDKTPFLCYTLITKRKGNKNYEKE